MLTIRVLAFFPLAVCWAMKNYSGYSTVNIKVHHVDYYSPILTMVEQGTACQVLGDGMQKSKILLLCSKKELEKLYALAGKDFLLTSEDIQVVIHDVGHALLDQLDPDPSRETSRDGLPHDTFNHDKYLKFDEMEDWLQELARKYSFVALKTIGFSAEGRPIYVVQIEARNGAKKPIVFVEAGAHAREWIGQAVALALIDRITKHSNVSMSQDILLSFSWHILPQLNPDGYIYTHEEDRFWSKNRNSNANSTCIGANLNRNFPSSWGVGPKDACDRSYIGDHPGSEPEVQAVMSYVQKHLVNNTIMALSLHCYGQAFILPYAGNRARIHPNLKLMKTGVEKALFYIFPYYFSHGRLSDFFSSDFDELGGTSMDFYADSGIYVTYTIELPDLGEFGFLLPPSEILPITNGIIVGIRRMCEMLSTQFQDGDLITSGVHVEFTTASTTTTTTTTTTFNPNHTECCTSLSLTSSGGALIAQPYAFGTYVLDLSATNNYTHGSHVYKRLKNNHFDHFLFRLPSLGIWVIGPTIGLNYAYLVLTSSNNFCPDKIPSQPWFYLSPDKTWKTDDASIQLKCTY